MVFENNKIDIKDTKKWDQLSMCCRYNYHMPSTTNSLEGTHGHMNANTPRNDTFYSSILRIHNEMNEKFININQRIKHNFNNLKRNTQNKLKSLNPITVEQMIIHYKTAKEHCLCSYNKLASSNYKCDVPCFHRILKGATFPEIPQLNLKLSHQYNELKIEYDFIKAENGPPNEMTEEINYIVSTIKFFSHFKKVEEIQKYVELHYYANNGLFINGIKVSVIQLIEEGVYHFRKIKKETKNAIINQTIST